MRILDRYIRRQVISSTVIVVLVLLGIQSFMELVNQLAFLGKGTYSITDILITVPMQMPAALYQLFPMAGFLGCLIGLGRLSNNSELTVMRAAGVSISRIAWSVVKTAIFMIVIVTAIGEMIAPTLSVRANDMQQAATHNGHYSSQVEEVWLRSKNNFIRLGKVVSKDDIRDILEFEYNNKHQLQTLVKAKSAKRIDNKWQLQDATFTRFLGDRVVTKHVEMAPLNIYFKASMLKLNHGLTEQDSLVTLAKNIWYRHKAGLVTSLYEFSFWRRIVQPITTIVMICLGVPFVFGSLRQSSMGFRIIMGILVGFGFYMLNQFFGPITMVYQFPPLLSATLPTLLFLVAYLVLIRRIT